MSKTLSKVRPAAHTRAAPRLAAVQPAAASAATRKASLDAEIKMLGCTSLRLRQLTRRVSHHYDLEMAKAGLKTTQFSLLTHVIRLGPVRPGELAKEMKLDASTLTRNVRPLIDAGWVELTAGSDARSRALTITPAGRAMREQARQSWKTAQVSLNELLGAERVLALHQLIDESLHLLAGDEFLETCD